MVKNLTTGKPSRVLWQFSIPMFISVVFQQFYNIADSVVAGKFAGEEALAAVGASYPITMIFMAVAVNLLPVFKPVPHELWPGFLPVYDEPDSNPSEYFRGCSAVFENLYRGIFVPVSL